MRPAVIAAALCLIAASAGTAAAAEPQAGPEDAFTFAPAEGRHLKIDRRSGRVSLCEDKDGTYACTLVPDDRDAYAAEIERLKARVADLEDEVARLKGDRRRTAAEDEQRFDRFLDFSDKAFRRFFNMVEDMKKDLAEDGSL